MKCLYRAIKARPDLNVPTEVARERDNLSHSNRRLGTHAIFISSTYEYSEYWKHEKVYSSQANLFARTKRT